MKSRTSFCNGTILKKNVTRFWPIWALITLILMSSFPLPLANVSVQDKIDDLLWMTQNELMPICVIFSILIAGCIFGYLHKSRSAIMMHSFPLNRGCLYRTGLLAGLLVFIVPWTASILLVTEIPYELLASVWLFGVLRYLFTSGRAVFCMLISGKTLASVVLYFCTFISPLLMVLFLEVATDPLLYGITSAPIVSEEVETVNLSPGESYAQYAFRNSFPEVITIALFGIGLLFFAGWLYRKRRMENAGNIIAYKRQWRFTNIL